MNDLADVIIIIKIISRFFKLITKYFGSIFKYFLVGRYAHKSLDDPNRDVLWDLRRMVAQLIYIFWFVIWFEERLICVVFHVHCYIQEVYFVLICRYGN